MSSPRIQNLIKVRVYSFIMNYKPKSNLVKTTLSGTPLKGMEEEAQKDKLK